MKVLGSDLVLSKHMGFQDISKRVTSKLCLSHLLKEVLREERTSIIIMDPSPTGVGICWPAENRCQMSRTRMKSVTLPEQKLP